MWQLYSALNYGYVFDAEPLDNEMWTAILPQGWTSPYGETF